jgi:hypothetical protein
MNSIVHLIISIGEIGLYLIAMFFAMSIMELLVDKLISKYYYYQNDQIEKRKEDVMINNDE